MFYNCFLYKEFLVKFMKLNLHFATNATPIDLIPERLASDTDKSDVESAYSPNMIFHQSKPKMLLCQT